MRSKKRWWHRAPTAIVAPVVLLAIVAPASATTLIRAGLDDLTNANSTIVLGEVLGSHSYWNEEGSFIFTDIEVLIEDVVKGQNASDTITVTLLGGTVGDITTVIVGAPSLELGNFYLLFLNQESLPGTQGRLTVRDHCQGAFDISVVDGELRARSQARSFGLLPDASGDAQPPGSHEGIELESLVQTLSALAGTPRPAVRRPQ